MNQPYMFDELVSAPSPRWTEHCESLSSSFSERELRGLYLSAQASISSEHIANCGELAIAAPVNVSGSIASITRLSLVGNGWMDQASARALPNLEALRFENQRPIQLSWFASENLKSLAIRERSICDHSNLATMPVEQFRLEWRALPFESFPRKVTGLVVNAWKAICPEELGKMGAFTCLKALTISGAAVLSDLVPLAALGTLTEVAVSTRSLVGLSDLTGLTGLRLSGPIPTLTELSGAPRLERLELFLGASGTAVLSSLPRLKALRRLEIDCVTINGFAKIDSLAFLERVAEIVELVLTGVSIEAADIAPIQELEHLRHVKMLGSVGPGVEELFRSRHVDMVDIKNIGGTGDAGDELSVTRVGARWGLFDDLRARLRVDNNYDAERLLRRMLADEAPELLPRLSFDTEAGTFSVTANERTDIESIVSLVRRLSIPPE